MNNKDSGSTQNRNSRHEYICEQQQNKGVFDYYTSKYYGVNNNNYYFSMGSVPQTPREHLSHNSVDTESFLRNIGSTNLVQPKPEFKNMDRSSARQDGLFYDVKSIVMPDPLVVFKNQRPGPTK